ncbi:MAG TPA: pyridoxamine 5'-phosphate oxidase [Acidimicrobiales bacterium]|jgi:pyridoxamine 5'-phosphate oxidase
MPQYPTEPLLEGDVDPDPVAQFDAWFEAAGNVVRLPEAVALATADSEGRPSVRMVLLRGWGADGFVFHTDYGSRKARELTANPVGALLLHWDALGRQIRIEGRVEKATAEESDAYFASRPRDRQIAAHSSSQSRPIESRDALDRRVQEVTAAFDSRAVPRPESWGGFRLRPESYEFWQGHDDRLHDRLRYSREGGGWRIERLQP